jgi:uroporphyrin-3 C-methyltransferase
MSETPVGPGRPAQDEPSPGSPGEPAGSAGGAGAPAPAPARSPYRGMMAAVALVLVLALAIGAGAGGYWLVQRVDALTARTQRREAALAGRVDQLARALDQAEARQPELVQAQVTPLRAELQALATRLQALEVQAPPDPRAWVAAEAGYLLLTANYRLHLANDPAGAARALEAASRRLTAAADPRLAPVRERLAADLAHLRSVPGDAIASIAAALEGLAREAQTLPMPVLEPTPPAPGGAPPAAAQGWRGALERVWRDLRGLVVVQRADGSPGRAWLLPEERRLVRMRLALALDSARLAALGRDTGSYRASLRVAQEWLRAHFLRDAPQVVVAIGRLRDLEGAELTLQGPDLLQTLGLLERATNAAPTPPIPEPQ